MDPSLQQNNTVQLEEYVGHNVQRNIHSVPNLGKMQANNKGMISKCNHLKEFVFLSLNTFILFN